MLPFTITKQHWRCTMTFRSAEDVYSYLASYPTFAFVGGPCCPILDIVFCLLDYDNVLVLLHIVNFAIIICYVQEM
jgi:hypothetical protein